MRFDDTNPAKETEEFEKEILYDVSMLKITPDIFSHTSDHFEALLKFCEILLRSGDFYVDDTPPDTIKKERESRTISKNRNNSIEKNLAMWIEMKLGTDTGLTCCVRAKIDMNSNNGCMRDPTMYRCKNENHIRTGSKYKVYPTYDFACPLVDSLEGVTHALRTTEYHDRDDQYYWIFDTLSKICANSHGENGNFINPQGLKLLHRPYIWEYSRLNMMHTVLSKRKLNWILNENCAVEGWDDPRFPTIRGILRRGLTVEGLKNFILAQGSSKSVVTMEWDKIWSFNKKVIEPSAHRYTALNADGIVKVNIKGVSHEYREIPLHPKNSEAGSKSVLFSPCVLVEQDDAGAIKIGDIVTFMNMGNVKIESIEKGHPINPAYVKELAGTFLPDNKDFKNTLKLTWLGIDQRDFLEKQQQTLPRNLTPITMVSFDYLITKPVLGKDEDFKQFLNTNSTWFESKLLGEPALKNVAKSQIIQLMRKGFFICDLPFVQFDQHTSKFEIPLRLFAIPDGSTSSVTPSSTTATTTVHHVNPKETDTTKKSFQSKSNTDDLNTKIIEQGDIIRILKAKKADKKEIEAQVKILLELKGSYKKLTNSDWKPISPETGKTAKNSNSPMNVATDINELDSLIKRQGDLIRQLKTNKADKKDIEIQVSKLLNLKSDYKKITNLDWKPTSTTLPPMPEKLGNMTLDSPPQNSCEGSSLNEEIKAQGDKIRQLKSQKADKQLLDKEVLTLLALKTKYKDLTGIEWKPASAANAPPPGQIPTRTKDKHVKGEAKKATTTTITKPQEISHTNIKKITRLGLEVKKSENFSEWYTQVITKSEMIEYYDVSGCYILRPWSYAIWEFIQRFFDEQIKALGVSNVYFPIFVSRQALELEEKHIADFSPEVAWVTRSGDTELAEPIAIRPTSETVMYPAYAKWIKSHRDLPLKLNQWNNVVRWEFKHPTPFIRTREFLWQEGHSAFATAKEATDEVYTILDLYARVYEELMAIPVVKGRKTEKEKFAGGDFTTTVEAYIDSTGRGIQGATSHHLGQNFSKIFGITFENPENESKDDSKHGSSSLETNGIADHLKSSLTLTDSTTDPIDQETDKKLYVYQNSWGITTRTIGVMVMIHGDDIGLVLPPRIAPIQMVIIPCGITANLPDTTKIDLLAYCEEIFRHLKPHFRIKFDSRDNYSPGWKFNHWELRGVPLRIEIGPKEFQSKSVVLARRDIVGDKQLVKFNQRTDKSFINDIEFTLTRIHDNLFEKAKEKLEVNTVTLVNWDKFVEHLDQKHLIQAPFCGEMDCEDEIKGLSASIDENSADPTTSSTMGAKTLCVPFKQPPESKDIERLSCVRPNCSNVPKYFALFGRSY